MVNVPGTFYTAETQRRGSTPVSPPNADDDPQGPIGGATVPPVAKRYASEAIMIADQLNQLSGYLYFDGTDTWWYLGAGTGVIGDYQEFGSGSSGGGGLELIPFSLVITMGGNYKSYHIQDDLIAYTRTSSGPTTNFENKTIHIISADGVNGKPTFSSNFVLQKDTWVNSTGSLNRLTFIVSVSGNILVWMENIE